jgi:beta-lactamase regulating signal transducer with metallopeptidase domain
MIVYIFKSSLSLLILFGLYWFLLRKEKLLIFNRFFLVLSIAFSLIIPLITISVNFQTGLDPGKIITTFENNISDLNPSQNTIYQDLDQSISGVQPSRISNSTILLVLYISGVVLFLFRFLKNIYFMFHQIKLSEKINHAGHKIVLVDNQTNPYCFFNTIFVNKQDYLNNNFDKDLLNHELEHIKQSHSIDI